ncbi:MAG: alpha-galactosidase [Fimbriimonadaceae bacterium]|nr:alpha-galactosidase [Fimbriimonadaceae bacterium]
MPAAAQLAGDLLALQTGTIRRVYRWHGGALRTLELRDERSGAVWAFPGDRPDLLLPGCPTEGAAGDCQVERRAGNAAWPAHLRITVTCRLDHLEVRRVFRLTDDVPAIASDLFVRGHAHRPFAGNAPRAYQLPSPGSLAQPHEARFFAPVTERLHLGQRHVRLTVAAFSDVTDLRNQLVHTSDLLPYRAPSAQVGNVACGIDLLSGAGFFVLREAPCSDMQLAYPGCDFVVDSRDLVAVGLGLRPDDLDEAQWTRAYGTVIGLGDGDLGVRLALHAYEMSRRVWRPGRDQFVMANTWGDRSQDSRVSEQFALGEIAAGQRFGITHLQLDDGWQAGRTANSAEAGGSLEGIWQRADYWAPHPERFPRGLAPVVAAGRAAGIEVCLWFNPSSDDSYAHWQDDSQTLIELYHQHGIRVFKIDGVSIPDKRADTNLRRIFDAVLAATDYEVTFNLDATASRRFGYHWLAEYGSVFVENRYTDWGNYYPHWTLRNLWQLARWLPTQRLQMEFLNLSRNAAKYADDALAPHRVPWEYAFALTMPAQPLVWCEVQNLPPEAFAIAPLVATYRQQQAALQAGCLLPIGDPPCGVGWTGFQSYQPAGGQLLVLREHSPQASGELALWGLAGRVLQLTPLAGAATAQRVTVDGSGRLTLDLPQSHSFGWYAYTVEA